MRILGIDPGLERIGYGLIERDANRCFQAVTWGVLTTDKAQPEAQRLHDIQNKLDALILEMQPDIAAVEKLFFFKNAKTVMPVSQARGVILLCLFKAGLTYWEYTPMQVKMNLTGYGKSDKREVQEMVQRIFNLDKLPRPDDAADALAIALSCAYEQGPMSLQPVSAVLQPGPTLKIS